MTLNGCSLLVFVLSKVFIYTMAESNYGQNETILIGFTGFYQLYAPPFQLYKLGSAFLIAQDRINKDETILPNHEVKYVLHDDGCEAKKGIGKFVTLVKDEGVIALIGPSCSGAAEIIGYLASQWNVPLIAYGGTATLLSNKKVELILSLYDVNFKDLILLKSGS